MNKLLKLSLMSFVVFMVLTVAFLLPTSTLANDQKAADVNDDSANEEIQNFPSGYYRLVPYKLSFCVFKDVSECKEAALDKIPQIAKEILSNPVGLMMQNPLSGQAVLFSPKSSNGYALPVYITQGSLDLNFSGLSNESVLWRDPKCKTRTSVYEIGKINMNRREGVLDGLALSGNIDFTIDVNDFFFGPCTRTFQNMMLCYDDLEKCEGSDVRENTKNQEMIKNYLNPYFESGALLRDDFAALKSLGYSVEYKKQ